jgi:hypothetical protein
MSFRRVPGRIAASLLLAFWTGGLSTALAATTVPTDIQQPGTQPNEVSNLETPDKCDNCHGSSGSGVVLANQWRLIINETALGCSAIKRGRLCLAGPMAV